MASRVGSVDLMLAVSAVNIQRQTGGNLSVILGNISTTIKERQKIKDDIRVLTATGRISGAVIGSIPVGIALILLLINPDYIMMFFDTQIGIFMLIVAAIMETIGFLVVKKMVTVKY
jgi:tight adherence protein B